jgi:SAM-dependent methyltransferase
MPDEIFANPRLAAIYDTFDGDRSDLDAYVALTEELAGEPAGGPGGGPARELLAEPGTGTGAAAMVDAGFGTGTGTGTATPGTRTGAATIVDVGCGTGNLAVRLAALGHTVIGVDPAAASLAVARAKPHAHAVAWIEGDATALPPLHRAADLALMTGNVAQVFLTDDDWTRTLRAIAATLRPGGHFVFETRRPERRAWEEWATETEPVVREVPGVGTVEERREALIVDLPYVTFRGSYRFPDNTVVTSESTLRFREREELEAALAECGFDVVDVREAPDRMGKEYVFIGQRRDHR